MKASDTNTPFDSVPSSAIDTVDDTVTASVGARINALSERERMACLDLLLRARTAADHGSGEDDPVARRLAPLLGPHIGLRGLHPSMPWGVRARRQALSRAIADEAARLAALDRGYELWILGGGFHGRLEPRALGSLPGTLLRAVEVDSAPLTDLKNELDRRAPAPGELPPHVAVERRVADTPNLAEALPDSDRPLIAVLEGHFDLLDAGERHALLDTLAAKAPNAFLVLDGLSEKGAAWDNRTPERYTGSPSVRLSGVPDDAGDAFVKSGWRLCDETPLFPAMKALFATRTPALGLVRHIPLPKSFNALYRMFGLRPVTSL